MEAGHLSLIVMVAPRIASVTFSLAVVSLDDLDNIVAIIREHSSHYKKEHVNNVAWPVDRVILGKCWQLQDDTKARTHGEWVFWDRFWAEATCITQALPTL